MPRLDEAYASDIEAMKNAAATTARSRRTTRHAGEHVVAAQVANQNTVLAIDAAAPARFNSAYVLVYFVGGSLGTAFGAAAVEWLGWQATAAVAAPLSVEPLRSPGNSRYRACHGGLAGEGSADPWRTHFSRGTTGPSTWRRPRSISR